MFIHEYVGTTHKSTNGPFQDRTQAHYKYKHGPYQCLKPQEMPANHKSVYFEESQGVMRKHPTSQQTALFRILPEAPYKYKNGPFQCLKPQASPANHNQFISTNHRGDVGTSQMSTNGPFQDLTQASYKYKNGPFQCLKPQASPVNHKSVYIDQSQVSLFWSNSDDTPTQRTK